jgi:hypothetical protein
MQPNGHNLAELNIGRLLAPTDDPRVALGEVPIQRQICKNWVFLAVAALSVTGCAPSMNRFVNWFAVEIDRTYSVTRTDGKYKLRFTNVYPARWPIADESGLIDPNAPVVEDSETYTTRLTVQRVSPEPIKLSDRARAFEVASRFCNGLLRKMKSDPNGKNGVFSDRGNTTNEWAYIGDCR